MVGISAEDLALLLQERREALADIVEEFGNEWFDGRLAPCSGIMLWDLENQNMIERDGRKFRIKRK